MASSQEDKGDVKERAVANIMKLINSQIALERKQSKMADKDKDAKPSTRMADLEDTIEKLVQVAKRKGYIDQDATVDSLKAEAQKGRESQTQEDAVSLMAAMKKNLDAQTAAVTDFMTDRVNHDAEWEENAWAKLLNSNQDILVLMARLHDRGFINQEMIDMATLPDKPPPPREQDMRGMTGSVHANGNYAPSTTADGSMMHAQYGNGSMMGYGQPMHPSMQGSMMNGMMPNGVMPNGMMPNGMMPNGMMPNGMMPNGMMPQQSWGMGGSMPGSMMGGMQNGMMQQQMMPNGSGMPMNASASFMSKGSKAHTTREDESSSSGSDDSGSEAELNERLRELKGLAKEREKGKKSSRAEQVERNLFSKHKGIGHFNNAFKVADDIRQLGAVPEDEEQKDAGLDKQMAKAMEERLLRNIEEDILRGKKDVIRSFMRSGDDAGGGAGAASVAGGSQMSQSGAAQSVMQMQMMQQQNMMALQQMMMSMGGSQPSYYAPSGVGGPSGMAGGPSMPGMPGGPSAMGGSMGHPSMMGQPNMMGMGMNPMMGMGMGSQMHPQGMGSQMGGMQNGMGSQMGPMQNGMGSQMHPNGVGSQMGAMGSQMQAGGHSPQAANGAPHAAGDGGAYES